MILHYDKCGNNEIMLHMHWFDIYIKLPLNYIELNYNGLQVML